MSRIRRVAAVVVVGVATLSLAAAAAPATGQPRNTCLATGSDGPVGVPGVRARSSILVETTKSERGRIVVYVIGDLDNVRSTDGAVRSLAGALSFQLEGRAQQRPIPFTVRATSEEDSNAFTGPDSPNFLELDGSRYLGRRVRVVAHVDGAQYPSGWATVGRGKPSCEP